MGRCVYIKNGGRRVKGCETCGKNGMWLLVLKHRLRIIYACVDYAMEYVRQGHPTLGVTAYKQRRSLGLLQGSSTQAVDGDPTIIIDTRVSRKGEMLMLSQSQEKPSVSNAFQIQKRASIDLEVERVASTTQAIQSLQSELTNAVAMLELGDVDLSTPHEYLTHIRKLLALFRTFKSLAGDVILELEFSELAVEREFNLQTLEDGMEVVEFTCDSCQSVKKTVLGLDPHHDDSDGPSICFACRYAVKTS